MWWFIVGPHAVIPGIVVFVAGHKRLITTISSTQRFGLGEVRWCGLVSIW